MVALVLQYVPRRIGRLPSRCIWRFLLANCRGLRNLLSLDYRQ